MKQRLKPYGKRIISCKILPHGPGLRCLVVLQLAPFHSLMARFPQQDDENSYEATRSKNSAW